MIKRLAVITLLSFIEKVEGGRWKTWLLLQLTALLAASNLFAQETVGVGQWRSYLSHARALQTSARGNVYYKLSSAGLALWDADVNQYRELSKVEGLSSADPTSIFYHPQADEMFVGYASGVIDRFQKPGSIRSIFDIAISNNVSAKGIRHLTGAGTLLYIATDFGIVGYDLQRGETRFSVLQVGSSAAQVPVYRLALFNNRLYALLDAGLFSAPLTGANLADPAAWRLEPGLPATGLQYLCATTAALYIAAGDSVLRNTGSTWQPFRRAPVVGGALLYMDANGSNVYLNRQTATAIYPEGGTGAAIQTRAPQCSFVQPGTGRVVVGDKEQGLVVFNPGTAQPVFARQSLLLDNNVTSIAASDGKLFIAPRGYVGRYQPSFFPGGVVLQNKPAGTFRILDVFNRGLDSTVYQDIGQVLYDRAANRAYFGSWGQGIVVTTDTGRVQVFNRFNSGLPGQLPDAQGRPQIIYIGGITVDYNGTLWCGSFDALTPLAAFTRAGRWFTFSVPGATRPLKMITDRSNYKWVALADQNLLVYDDAGNPAVTANHRRRILTTDAGNGALPAPQVNDLAEDADGTVWAGTSRGVAAFYNAPNIFNAGTSTDAVCPVFQQRCLLRDENIAAIAVDGANCKWIGTSGAVYRVNPDGSQVLAQFTPQNSPLPSGNIRDIAVDPQTGEVYIATDAGLVSYRGTATEPQAANDLYIYPNPVYSDYTGPIAIRGLGANSMVRITTISGQLVNTLASDGGQALWYGIDANGRRIRSGVYLVLASGRDGRNLGSGKIAFIER